MTTIETDMRGVPVRYRLEQSSQFANVLRAPGVTFRRGSDGAWCSSWGYHVECKVCGAVSEAPAASSVSCEDAEHIFARDHIHPNRAELAEEIRRAELAHRIAGYRVDELKRQQAQAID